VLLSLAVFCFVFSHPIRALGLTVSNSFSVPTPGADFGFRLNEEILAMSAAFLRKATTLNPKGGSTQWNDRGYVEMLRRRTGWRIKAKKYLYMALEINPNDEYSREAIESMGWSVPKRKTKKKKKKKRREKKKRKKKKKKE
jgi:hypothetical protein